MHYFLRLSLLVSACLLIACGGSDGPLTSNPIPTPPPVAETPFTVEAAGLEERIIERLYQHEHYLFALTDNGLYRSGLTAETWQLIGFADMQVLDLSLINDHHFMAAVRHDDNDGYPVHSLFESTDAGQSWHEIKHNFGGTETEGIYALAYQPEQHLLYGSGLDVVAVSSNFGMSWQVLYGDWHTFGQPNRALAINSELQEVWSGGQGATENPLLYQYKLEQNSLHTHHQRMHEILTSGDADLSPVAMQSIRFGVQNPEHIYASGEGGIAFSSDNGLSWVNLMGDVDSRFYFDVILDPTVESRLFTAGWDKNFDSPQPLILEWSKDNGQSWEQFTYPNTAVFGGVRSMLALQHNQQLVLYFGLYRGGVMKVTPNF
ncbi:hypothetical protein Q3O60_12475 [Alkalimonas collagenimarina]|uniref:Uncharacterized protein n=1 Tax=Alkalimonas collagenimarina TaxID=400390 RepID=A0ABT9H1R8_9GAMM|nr:hypothetical protein [Alkalimonas collagenimarina]MDP4537009.1 hypothetical protein [Alkalimonas collagenimarina]